MEKVKSNNLSSLQSQVAKNETNVIQNLPVALSAANSRNELKLVTSKHKIFLNQWFYNLPISYKFLIALISAQLLQVAGIFGAMIAFDSVDTRLVEQVKSEVATSVANYQAKSNQTALGFRAQADNSAIQQITALYDSTKVIKPDLAGEVRQILENEIEARKIEYATLVGSDLKIIANANQDRKGEIFDPNNLVSEMMKNGKQMTANVVVSSAQLSKESPALPSALNNQDVLVRFTVTPIKSRFAKQIIGALVAGEVVNGKEGFMSEIFITQNKGYNAIYLRNNTGDLALVTPLRQGQAKVDFPDKSFLTAVAAASGKILTKRITIGNQTYIVAAKTLPHKILGSANAEFIDFTGNPAAILLRGIPETSFTSFLPQTTLILIIVFLSVPLCLVVFKQTIAKPLAQLEETVLKFIKGDYQTRAEVFSKDEVGQLAATFNQMAGRMAEQSESLDKQIIITKFFNEITRNIHESLDTKQILRSAVIFTREALKTDRVVVFCFDENWKGNVIAESVASKWPATLEENIYDPCFALEYIDKYKKGRVTATENIYKAGLTQCHISLLEEFSVKANLVTPILIDRKLYGLLIAHHCSAPREWQESEIKLLQQVAEQIGLALFNANLMAKVKTTLQTSEESSTKQQQKQELLQQDLIELLEQIQDVYRGDLTVRASEKTGEIRTVADVFNFIVENLWALVTQVNTSTMQVNSAIEQNKQEIKQITIQTQQQSQEISYTLEQIDQMILSTQEFSNKINQIIDVTNNAVQGAAQGGEVMELTAQKIFHLRESVLTTVNQVRQLNESTQEISHVVSLINQMTMQSKVLAVNAGIEAAHRGEDSKGFDALLEEVRQLATTSEIATQEIEKTLLQIQQETSAVVKAMELSTAQVAEDSRLVEKSKHNFYQIESVLQQISFFAQSISQTTVSQKQTLQTVTNSIQEIAKISKCTSESSRDFSASLQQTALISQQLGIKANKYKVI
jgi:twitching motility protein PilJ